ncbi:MAG: acyl-CoA dehydrogenase [Deltaproteobacteria bacterium]|nr:acyl-CoA dehydrogenase [Deltaproteobacteria bacterium]
MGHFKINIKDIFFILKEQLSYGNLCSLDRYKGFNEKAFDLLVNEAMKFAKGIIDPLNMIGETNAPKLAEGQVKCTPEFKKAFRQYGEDGWTALSRDTDYGGQGFPNMMRIIINDIMYGACQAFNIAPNLTHGAAHLIETFGTKEQKSTYVPKMFDGKWAGTMCLTESDAGSNLSGIQTTACPDGEQYKIKGFKIFISWGDHDLTDNIIHLVLARIEGAPKGSHGISLFIVPKMCVNPDGTLGEPNDVICTGIEEKMGLHASPTASLSFGARDNCIGYLCGRKNKGLSHMFQMMNAARINTGVSGLAIASTAYRNALVYAKTRIQGNDIGPQKKGRVTIIKHPDVRRMLLWMKAMVDGMRSMIYSGAYWAEMAEELPQSNEKNHYINLIEFMTPIIKAYCSDMGFKVCETAIQCLGGYGYCKDFPLEQYLRDVKIMSLYEGTNGIQAADLMGRKMTINNGACFLAFKKELTLFCEKNRTDEILGSRIRALKGVANNLFETALTLNALQKKDPLQFASYTYPALISFSEVTMVWRLLDMALVAQASLENTKKSQSFYKAKLLQASYFADMTLPLIQAGLETFVRPGREILDIADNAF